MPEPAIERRAARMSAVATVRQVLGLPLGLASAITVARLYLPRDLGRFAVLSFVVTLPTLVGDLGLSQAFVRQADEPPDADMATAASLQLWIAAIALPAILIGVHYAEPRSGAYWLGLALALYLPTLAGAFALRPTVLIQRRLDFARLALLDLAQQVVYIAVLLGLGLAKAGLAGLVGATTVGQVLRTAVLWHWYPGAVAAVPRLARLRDVMRSGLPLQLTGIVSGFHTGLLNWLGAPLFGPVAVGYLRWSLDMTNRLGTGLAHAIGTVVFPTIALLQEDSARLRRVVERAVRYNLLLIGVPLALLAGLATPVIAAIFGGRWAPATVALQLFSALAIGAAALVPLDAAVRVVRPTTWSLGLVTACLVFEVAVVLALARPAGFLAVPLAHLAATVTLVALLRALMPAGARPAWPANVGLPALALATTFLVSRWIAGVLAPWPALFAGCAAGTLAAAAVVFALGQRTVWPDLMRDLRNIARTASPA